MNRHLLEQIVEAVLYEGYILYPYRPTAKKNARERFTFGRVYPQAYSAAQQGAEPCAFQTECLVKANAPKLELNIEARFLQPMARQVAVIESLSESGAEQWIFKTLPELRLGKEVIHPWTEAVERRIPAKQVCVKRGQAAELSQKFSFAATRQTEPVNHPENMVGAVLIREQHDVNGELDIRIQPLRDALFKVTVRICNRSPVPPGALGQSELILMQTFASTHVTLYATGGEFISLLDPPPEFQLEAAECRNSGLWPVLVGDDIKSERDMMLASPIILYDYPKIAPESAGPLFDGTEIDEILSLRILTMTDEEKLEMRNVDAHARALLERTEALSKADMWRLHGTQREPISLDEQIFGNNKRLHQVQWRNGTLKSGDRVRISPKGRADVMDIALAGRTAVVESVEQDAEQRIHLALVLDDDPGKDLGLDKQTGHRFFFGLDEVEAIP